MQITILVVALKEERAEDWVRQQGLYGHPDFKWRYVYDRYDLQGYRRALVMLLPGWWKRKDAEELRDHLKAREAVCVHVDDESRL